MEDEEFYDLMNLAEGLCHVEITAPLDVGDWTRVEFLEGPLKGQAIEFNKNRLC